MNETDLELLARYTKFHSDAAFSELVRRHLNLVHSAARRQVHSQQLAEEVAQSTFIKLARQAHRLAPNTILTAWLYQVTRREAIDVIRREARRKGREQTAVEIISVNAHDENWTQIAPLLDEAMESLNVGDRAAVLLRFFENKSFFEVGTALGTTDDTARKRVNRAVERLREFFASRGVTVGAGHLVVAISGNAIQHAPAGLAVALASAALSSATTAGSAISVALTQFVNSAGFKASAAALTCIGLVVGLLVNNRSNLRLRNENLALTSQLIASQNRLEQAETAQLTAKNELETAIARALEVHRLRAEVTELRNQIAQLSTRNQQSTNSTSLNRTLSDSELKSLLQRIETVPIAITKTRRGDTLSYQVSLSRKAEELSESGKQQLRALGQRVLPQLLALLRSEDVNLPAGAQRGLHQTGRFQRWQSVKGFYALGSNAVTAMPQLLTFRLTPPEPDDDAAYALAGIGPTAVPQLTEALSSDDVAVAQRARLALDLIEKEALSTETAETAPQTVTDDPIVQLAARFALSKTDADPERAVSTVRRVVRDRLNETSSLVLLKFCNALERYGTESKAAVPILLEMLPQVDETEAAIVRRTLEAIDPKAATLGGIQ